MPLIFLLSLLLMSSTSLASGQIQRAPFEELARQYDYDSKAPLDVQESGRLRRDGVTVIDLTYASPLGGRVPAYLVVPDGKGPFAAIIFGHWMMPNSPMRNRREFLEEAVLLGRSGAVSILTDCPLVRPGFVEEKDELRSAAQSAEASRQQVIDFRRAVDLLTARRDVDAKRIAYVGHSFDAHVGSLLSAVEKRISSFVLMAGVFADEEYVFDPENAEMRKFRDRLGDESIRAYFIKYPWDDPVYFVPHSAPAAVFLQFGRQDKPIPESAARHYYDLFAEPKKLGFYEAGHALNAAARRERVEWLVTRLSLRPVDRAALARIPELK